MSILDFIWPRACEICMRPVDRPGRYLCSDCINRASVVPLDGLCRKCGREATGLEGEYLCDNCRMRHPQFDRVGSVLVFEGEMRRVINRFKFENGFYLRDDFVDLMEGLSGIRFDLSEVEAVVAVPLALFRRFIRGYNQCEVLAKELARRLNKPYYRMLKRIGHPPRQSDLTEDERWQNVKGTFAIGRMPKILPKTVLLVDDIMTTGATLSECARILKAVGVKTVNCLTLARPPRK